MLDALDNDPTTSRIPIDNEPKTNKKGIAVQGTKANELIVVSQGAIIKGIIDGGGGKNVLQLDSAEGGYIGETRKLMGLDVKQGIWTLNGPGDFTLGALIRPEAMLTNDGRIHGEALAHGMLVNNGGIGAGATVFPDGFLKNTGTIEGDVNVHPGGILTGNGLIGNLNMQGYLRVNRAQGAPKITGDMRLSNTAELTYAINTDGVGETIKVGGTASLDNATLKIVAVPGEYPQSTQHTIIEAKKIDGEFGSVLNNLAFMTTELTYNRQSGDKQFVDLTYARNEVPIDNLATTENGRELARSVEEPSVSPTSHTTNAAVTALLGTTIDTAPLAIELLAGDSNANLVKTTLSSVSPVSSSMLTAMRQLDSASDFGNQNNAPRLAAGNKHNGRVWLQALGHGGKLDRHYQDLKYSTEGLVLGADWGIDEQWRLGVIGGKSSTRMDSRELNGKLDSWHLGAYALRQNGPVALRLGAIHSQHDGSNKRDVTFHGFSDRPKGRYDANTQQAFAEVGYNLGRANVSLEPFASIGYQRYQRDSFTEKGGAAALKVHGQTNENFSNTFGLRLAQTNGLDNGMQLTPRLSAGWKHTYGEIYNHTRLRLVDGGKDFTVSGAPLDRDTLMLDAGLDLRASVSHTLGVGLTGEAGSDSRSYGVMGQWRIAF